MIGLFDKRVQIYKIYVFDSILGKVMYSVHDAPMNSFCVNNYVYNYITLTCKSDIKDKIDEIDWIVNGKKGGIEIEI